MSKENKWVERTREDIAGWWSPDDMAVIQGIVLDGMVITDKATGDKRLVWVVKLTEPTLLHKAGSPDAEEFPAGTVAGVGHRAKLAPIIAVYQTTDQFEVRIKPEKQVRIQGGRSMWLFRVATSGGKPRHTALHLEAPQRDMKQLAAPKQEAEEADFEASDDIPF